jgi:serine/threonine protein kinase
MTASPYLPNVAKLRFWGLLSSGGDTPGLQALARRRGPTMLHNTVRSALPEAERFSFETRTHGKGGFARVIRGRDNELERDIAVKVLNPLATQFSPPEQERFRREARILGRLSHPNIPSVYDVDFRPGRFIIVSQFIEGTNLCEILDEQGSIDFDRARSWFHQIASALEHAHQLGIVHRDVKPGNILITPDRESAYLVDFGIALSQSEALKLAKSGAWIGTPGYMSPEQETGEAVDSRSDLYSLGVTLYEALSGKRIPQGLYEDLSLINQAIPPQIDDLVRACLEPRDRRLESAKAFGVQLASAFSANRPLSEVLAHGRLHEIAVALQDMTADDFMKLPAGQRTLILVKLDDVVESPEPNLQLAAAQFLELLLTRGILLEKESYRRVVAPAINRGFERDFGQYMGRRTLRDALQSAASVARAEAYSVVVEEFVAFMERAQLSGMPAYLRHECRGVLQALLANPTCNAGAKKLAEVLRRVNKEQSERG